MDLVEVLKKTKEVLHTRGRRKHDLVGAEGRVCLLGAVGKAVFDHGFGYADLEDDPTARAAIEALSDVIPESFKYQGDEVLDPVWRFNDRTDYDSEVFLVIDRAIEAAAGA